MIHFADPAAIALLQQLVGHELSDLLGVFHEPVSNGLVEAGARPVELAVPAVEFMEALTRTRHSVRGALNQD